MARTITRLFFFGAFLSLPFFSFAWGVLGHRIVGEIASYYLTDKARSEIQKILGTESIALASNWADFIKSDSTFSYLNPWHYIDFDKGLSREQVLSYMKTDTATDIYTKLNFLVKELKNENLPLEQKRMDLRLIIHFVGDLHQPMHAAYKEDLGGNKVKVTWFSNATNLHAVWDEALINFQQLSYTEYTAAINHTTAKERRTWQQQPINKWIAESHEIAEQLYNEITDSNQKLGYEYNFHHIQTVNDRLLKGGVRLAGLLNSIFQ